MDRLDTLMTDELSEHINLIDERMETLRAKSYLKIARKYRDAIVPFL